MAIYNVFVKLLDGTTATLKFPNQTISVDSLKTHLHSLTQIPPHHQRLITGTKQIHNQTLFTLPTNDSTIHLLLRLVGGKGGFGSQIRAHGHKAGKKKRDNLDSCRDMLTGKRLRHVNAEKKLLEWKAEEEDRKLERVAMDFLKKKVKELKKSGGGETEKYVKKAREDSEKCREIIDASVRESYRRSVDVKRKLLPSSGPSLKRMKGKDESSESDDEEGDDEDKRDNLVYDVMRYTDMGSPYIGSSDGEENAVENNGAFEAIGNSTTVEIQVEANNGVCFNGSSPKVVESLVVNDSTVESDRMVAVNDCNTEKPLDFGDYNSAVEMEVLGVERLKSELQAHGLKCGGTLQERPDRLFLLKTTPVEKLPKKLLAKK